jgi:hypothetical protein
MQDQNERLVAGLGHAPKCHRPAKRRLDIRFAINCEKSKFILHLPT